MVSSISVSNYKEVSMKPGDKAFLLTLFQTTLAHIIAYQCKRDNQEARFVTMSATMSGVNDVKDVVKIAKNELTSFKRRTILFMDEIHRFNKLQQVQIDILTVIFPSQFLTAV
jgi:Holliday junction resolvasome RuvABC ATP-dependent DNA helicase subunit